MHLVNNDMTDTCQQGTQIIQNVYNIQQTTLVHFIDNGRQQKGLSLSLPSVRKC